MAGTGLGLLALPTASDVVRMSIPPPSSCEPACRGPHAGIDSLGGRDRTVAGLLADHARGGIDTFNVYLVTLTQHERQCPSERSPSLAVSYAASNWQHLDGRPASLPSLAVKPESILGVSPLQHAGDAAEGSIPDGENVRPVRIVGKA